MKDDAEEVLCGMMLIDNSVIPSVYDIVKPGAFNNQVYRDVYSTIYSMYNRGLVVDALTLFKEMKNVPASVVSDLTSTIPSAVNFKYYAEGVKADYLKRGLKEIAQSTVERIEKSKYSSTDQINQMYSQLQGQLAELTSNANSCHVHNMKDLVGRELVILDSYAQNKRDYLGLDTGFEGLNDVLNGLQPVYMILGARPSMGKTALLQKIAMNIAKNEKVIFIELEMSMQQLTERAIAMLSGIPHRRIQSGLYTTAQMAKMQGAIMSLSELVNFIPVECFTRNLSDIMNICRAQVRNNGVKAIFIDHAGLIRDDISGERNAYERARCISNELQKLQRELGVPVVAASQLGRESETKKVNADKVGLSNIRGSGAFEEDADICAFIIRDRSTGENEWTGIDTIIDVQKNRNGKVGRCKMVFYPETVDFVELQSERRDKPPEMPPQKAENKAENNAKADAPKSDNKGEYRSDPSTWENPEIDIF